MLRRTKIVATLGPATDDPKILDNMLAAGIDVARLNFSHGHSKDHIERAEAIRNRARASGRQVGVLVDLQGPKIRIDNFKAGSVQLTKGDEFILDSKLDADAGDEQRVGISYKELPKDVKRGDTLLLADGQISLWVNDVVDGEIICRVMFGGELSNKKGINRQGGGLSAGAITEKDKQDVIVAAEIEADYLAISFVRTKEDVEYARELFQAAGGKGGIVAKIERAEALETDTLADIIEVSDVVMIARGDLGVEVGDAELPAIQKKIIKMARSQNTIAITATQMMQSMVDNPIPTRAEVFDVANAVLDGTDAVMLSEETAVGQYPDKAIKSMARICLEAEKQREARISAHRINTTFGSVDESIAMAAMYTGNHLGVKAIASLTESGSTVLWMSRISSGIPIYAMTRHVQTRRRVTLFRGVYPVSFDVSSENPVSANQEVIDELLRRGTVRTGDLVIITRGDLTGVAGGTNVLKIVKVGEQVSF